MTERPSVGGFGLSLYLEEWANDLGPVRQCELLDETAFIAFCRAKGLPVWGVTEGDPSEFLRRGWLRSDGENYDGGHLFHPFRMFVVHKVLEGCSLRIARSAALERDSYLQLTEKNLGRLSDASEMGARASEWNKVCDLAILAEPLVWPNITGVRRGGASSEEFCKFKALVEGLVRVLDPGCWRSAHESLLIDAGGLDPNSSLYLLLRLSTWEERWRLEGRVSAALWIRHMAEVLRRVFENVHDTEWLEEDRCFGNWSPGGRERAFGSERPLDDEFRSKPYIAYRFGLFTGSAVRWYVEGATECSAVRQLLPDAADLAIEIVDLRGEIGKDKGNAPLRLEDHLKEDLRLRRFSMVSIDADKPANLRVIRGQVKKGNVVGMVTAHSPDFEFANFDLSELVEIAAKLDTEMGFNGDLLRSADWRGISCGRDFDAKYQSVSERRSSVKGESWGRALADHAAAHRRRPGGKERPILNQLFAAAWSWRSNYDRQKEQFLIDPITFALKRVGAE